MKWLLLLGVASTALSALVRVGPRYVTVSAAGTPATSAVTDQLITQQGSGVQTQYGDFIAAAPGAGGL